MQGLGGTGAQQAKDCAFPAGSIAGAPLKVSWFLVIFFIKDLIDAVNNRDRPKWVLVTQVTGNQLILLLTVLLHEMGHGLMARRCGGDISEVLLWPFGGICFTTRPSGRTARQKLVDDLWIVAAGPATHFPQAISWLVLLSAFGTAFASHVVLGPSWHLLIPFSQPAPHCIGIMQGCFHTWTGYLSYSLFVQAIQTNVMLFIFNVFFPMYPMDGAKLIVCSLQLFCGCRAKCAAKVLIYTSGPLSVLFIGMALRGMRSGGGMQPGIMLYMGVMCMSESYKIYKLMQEERLHMHPLFEQARSETRSVTDGAGTSQRLNASDHDDAELAAPRIQISELQPFSGAGTTLGGGGATPGSGDHEAPSTGRAAANRMAWLQKVEQGAREQGKTVRQLEDERLARDRQERERLREAA